MRSQEDTILGPPDWDEVKSATAIDFGELLPSKKALQRLIDTIDDDDDDDKGDAADDVTTDRSIPAADGKDGAAGSAQKRMSSPAATWRRASAGLGTRGSATKRTSARVEKLQGIVHEMHARAAPTSSDNALKATPSLNRGSLASVKSLGHAAEMEVDNVLRTTKSADFGARGGSGSTPDVVDPATVVLERGAGLASNACDSEGVCTGAKNFEQHDIVVVLILIIVVVHIPCTTDGTGMSRGSCRHKDRRGWAGVGFGAI